MKRSWWAPGAALLFLAALPFVRSQFLLHMIVMTGIWAMLATSLNLLVGQAGQISLGHGAFYAIGAYTSALLTLRLGLPPWAGLLAAALVAAIMGALVGYPAFRTRGTYFSIVTLAVGVVTYQVLNNWLAVTRGPMGVPGIPSLGEIHLPGGLTIDFLDKLPYAYLVWLLYFGALKLIARLVHSHFGENLIGIKENERLAWSLGVGVHGYKVFIHTISTGLAGLAGGLFAHYVGVVSPDTFAGMTSFQILVLVVVGGAGTVGGPLLGAVVLTALPELLRSASEYRLLVYGGLLLLIVLVLPDGLIGLPRLFSRRGRGRAQPHWAPTAAASLAEVHSVQPAADRVEE